MPAARSAGSGSEKVRKKKVNGGKRSEVSLEGREENLKGWM